MKRTFPSDGNEALKHTRCLVVLPADLDHSYTIPGPLQKGVLWGTRRNLDKWRGQMRLDLNPLPVIEFTLIFNSLSLHLSVGRTLTMSHSHGHGVYAPKRNLSQLSYFDFSQKAHQPCFQVH